MSDTILDGVRIVPGLKTPKDRGDAVTYSIVSASNAAQPGREKRAGERQRTRLRSGKVLTEQNRFVVECLIYDVSKQGARLRVTGPSQVPDLLRLYRDDDHTLAEAKVVWRDPCWIGIEFIVANSPPFIRASELAALGSKYYSVDPRGPAGRRDR